MGILSHNFTSGLIKCNVLRSITTSLVRLFNEVYKNVAYIMTKSLCFHAENALSQ